MLNILWHIAWKIDDLLLLLLLCTINNIFLSRFFISLSPIFIHLYDECNNVKSIKHIRNYGIIE